MPNAPSATALSREVGVPQPTLSLWLRRARSLRPMTKEPNENAKPTHAAVSVEERDLGLDLIAHTIDIVVSMSS